MRDSKEAIVWIPEICNHSGRQDILEKLDPAPIEMNVLQKSLLAPSTVFSMLQGS